jgi:hypothetical protein
MKYLLSGVISLVSVGVLYMVISMAFWVAERLPPMPEISEETGTFLLAWMGTWGVLNIVIWLEGHSG